jgi:C4-dicarboxylate transporter, DctM subunit
MDYNTASILCACLMLFLLLIGVPIAYALGFSSILVGYFAFGSFALQKAGWTTFQLLYNLTWTPLPLFTLMSFLIAETSMGEHLFRAARNWLSRLPGGLFVAAIMGEAGMAAALGASGPTIIAVGNVAVPEFKRYSYDKATGLGALTCGGVLGPLIPPSATMIIYAILASVPLGHLFIAGVIPGIVLAVMLSIVPVVMCTKNPQLGRAAGKISWSEKFSSLKNIWPIVLVMFGILGSIYFGIATPTEAGGVGCFIVLVIAVLFFNLRLKGLKRALIQTAVLNATLMIILVSSSFFTYVFGSSSVAQELSVVIASWNLPSVAVVVAIMVFLLFLGCFIDGITIMMLTVPIFVPIIKNLGFDPVWFGILFVINMEIALITPPMGINFFLVKKNFDISSLELIKGVWPFLIMLVLFLAVAVTFPQMSLWLPGLMTGN